MTSLQSLPVPDASAFHHDASVSGLEQDRRWADWLAKGREHDARLGRRARWLGGFVVAAIISWGSWALAG